MELGLKNELTIEDMIEDLNIKFGLTFKIEENFRGRTIGTRLYGNHSLARVEILINRISDYLNYEDNCWAEKLEIREIVPEFGNEYDIELSFIQGEKNMWKMTIVYKHEEVEKDEVLFKDKETAEYFRDYFYKDNNIAYVRIDEIEEG